MKNILTKFLSSFLVLMVLGVIAPFSSITANGSEIGTSSEEKSTIWVIGDSTVSEFSDNYYYPRYGYGTQIANYVDSSKFEVKNLALSGRSSKSYISEKQYSTLLKGMKDGDYLIIGFGHNDEKKEEARYTNPNGDYTTDGSFANVLYENYIKPAENAGVTTILCTPIVRRTDDGVWSNSSLHITSSDSEYEGGDYAQSIRNLGNDLNINVVDLTSLTKNLYDSLGNQETAYLHAWTSKSSTSIDNTHTNIWGAKVNAYFIAKTVKALNVGTLSNAILDDTIKEMPTKANSLTINPNFADKDYDSNLAQSIYWNDADIWKGSVFGSLGGEVNKISSSYSLGQDDNGNINIAVRNNKGKIGSTADGIAMYYYKVPVGKQFTLTATATVNSFDLNSQVSFGLMARDDMYIDKNMTESLGDYVAAGPLKLADATPWNCFARKSGVLTKGSTFSNTTFEQGSQVDLKIQSNSDGYACTIGNETSITGGFDFALTAVDSEYVYVGMYVARNADVTFSNVKLIVDGVELTASNGTNDDTVTDDDNKNDGNIEEKPGVGDSDDNSSNEDNSDKDNTDTEEKPGIDDSDDDSSNEDNSDKDNTDSEEKPGIDDSDDDSNNEGNNTKPQNPSSGNIIQNVINQVGQTINKVIGFLKDFIFRR